MGLFQAGDTFLIDDPNGPKQHLHIVLSCPTGTPPTILAVPLNTLTHKTDRTVVLNPGDHPFVGRPTAVSFDLLAVLSTDLLAELEAEASRKLFPSFRRHAAIKADLLERIINGALNSPMTPEGMVRELRTRLNL